MFMYVLRITVTVLLASCSVMKGILPPEITYEVKDVSSSGIRLAVLGNGEPIGKEIEVEIREYSKRHSYHYRPESDGSYLVKLEDLGLVRDDRISSLSNALYLIVNDQYFDITSSVRKPYEDYFNGVVNRSNEYRRQQSQMQLVQDNASLKSKFGLQLCDDQVLMYGLFGRANLLKTCIYKLDHMFVVQNQIDHLYTAHIDPAYNAEFLQVAFKEKSLIATGTRINNKYVKYLGVRSFTTVLGATTNLHVLEILGDL